MSYNTEKSNVKLEKKVYKPFTINLSDLLAVVKQDLKVGTCYLLLLDTLSCTIV